ncbi:MAG: PadR family transcriptional regulator [Minwuia sp.]|uniref:PadR family transcriptional regulator n=1 Tax=Minwuia sp. TaxID=2493630 RepID=UPI003A8C3470
MDIRTLCLGLLTMRDSTGYEIKKTFEQDLSHFYDASFGSIYPALTKMTEEKLVTCTEQAQDGRPDKKVYSITPTGRMVFLDALAREPRKDRIRSEFLAMLMFADLMAPSRVAHLIDSRIRELDTKIDDLDGCHEGEASNVDRFMHGFGAAVYRAEREYLNENRHLLEAQALMANTAAD